MKFIHAADIHLDSPLKGLNSYPDSPAERLRAATRQAFEKLVEFAVTEKVDFMIIAGDLYDGKWKDHNTGLFFVKQMGLLKRAGIPVYLIYGNHDAESEMTKALQLPDNVFAFSPRKAQTFRNDALKVAVHGQSFQIPETTQNLVPGYPEPVPGWLNIGVLHTALEGNAEHARYAPCSIAELEAKGYEYWALGHVHEYSVKRDKVAIAYPGNLQGRHVGECGAKGALLVTAQEDRIIGIERIYLDVLRWKVMTIDVTAAQTFEDAVRLVGAELGNLICTADHDLPYALRIEFTGETVIHGQLLSREGHLRQEVIAQVVGLDAGRIWVEKVKIRTQPRQKEAKADSDEAVAGLFASLDTTARNICGEDDLFKSLVSDVREVLNKVPHDVFLANAELDEIRRQPEVAVRQYLNDALVMLHNKLESN